MGAQWDMQQAMTELRVEMITRFDRLEIAHLNASVERARLDLRVEQLETRAGWIGAGIGAALAGVLGLMVAAIKTKFGW